MIRVSRDYEEREVFPHSELQILPVEWRAWPFRTRMISVQYMIIVQVHFIVPGAGLRDEMLSLVIHNTICIFQ